MSALIFFHLNIKAGTGRLTKAPINKDEIPAYGLNRPLIKYSTTNTQMDEYDWLTG